MNSINSVNRPSGTLGTLINARVARVLMICSNYDAFILEEDGKIESQVYSEYIELGMSDPPAFTWANSSAAAKALMDKGEKFDLIICMFNEQDTGIFPLQGIADGISDVRIALVSVETSHDDSFAVEIESVRLEADRS